MNKQIDKLADVMTNMNLQVNDLLKWSEIIDLTDFSDKEIERLGEAYHKAAIETEKINQVIYECCKRLREDGIDLFERAKSKEIRKDLLKGVR